MKTSKKILLFIASVILVMLIINIVILRNTVQSKLSETGLKLEYKSASVANFEKLDFSSNMIVRIKQGKDCKVEFTSEEDSVLNPRFENINGTLHCLVDTSSRAGSMHVRITMPVLLEIKATQGTEINITNFQADSLHVILGNGCIFKGKNNTLKQVTFKTSGDALVQIANTF